MFEHYPFENRPLPYACDAMNPYIDEKTMRLHHDKHLQTYIDNLNRALAQYPQFQRWTLEQLILGVPSLPDEIQTAVRNNAGGVFNHRFYFDNLKNPSEGQPRGVLRAAIDLQYGSFPRFKDEFQKAALSVFGSGYAWLVVDATGALRIITTPNQETPLTLGMCPVLVVDVWEHAYYLKHFNMRADYIADWFAVVNWEQAERNYRKCFELEG